MQGKIYAVDAAEDIDGQVFGNLATTTWLLVISREVQL